MLGELLDRLSIMGIEPLGAIERSPNLVEKRVWTMQTASAEEPDEVDLVLHSAILASSEQSAA